MPIATKKIPQEFLNQIKTNLTKTEKTEETSAKPAATSVSKTSAEPKKGKYADVMNIRLSEGRRDEIKKFCTNCGVSITQYIESSFEYLSKEVAAGRIVISKGGISSTVN